MGLDDAERTTGFRDGPTVQRQAAREAVAINLNLGGIMVDRIIIVIGKGLKWLTDALLAFCAFMGTLVLISQVARFFN